jgi:hypothetical protein
MVMTRVVHGYDRDSSNGVRHRIEDWAVLPILKVGLLNPMDVQRALEPCRLVYERVDGSRSRRRGFGDTLVRSKCNLWGTAGGSTALAVTPYLKVRTRLDDLGNRHVDAGPIAPTSATLPGDFHVGLTPPRVNALRDEDDRGDHLKFGASIVFGHVEAVFLVHRSFARQHLATP